MKRHEKGQGMVEYALILVLVAVVVIATRAILGPQIGGVFCQITAPLDSGDGGRVISFPDQEVSMGTGDEFLNIDVTPAVGGWFNYVSDWGICGTAIYGNVVYNRHGIFTYYPYDVGSEADDSFTFRATFSTNPYRVKSGTGRVNIIVGERDEGTEPAVSTATSASFQENSTTTEVDEVREQVLTLYEAALWQEESIEEGVEFNIESVVEGVEFLLDYAGDVQNQSFSENLALFLQAVEDGNFEAAPEIFNLLVSDLDEASIDVHVAMNLEMAPRLIAACEVVSNGFVTQELMVNALQAVEGLDDDYPGKLEILQSLQEAVDVIETRNFFIQEHTSFQSGRIDKIIELLELAGEHDLAEQLAVDSEVCNN